MLKKALLLLSGNASAALLLLVRNLVVAWLIPVEDYGIAVTFAVTMALVEMSTQFGLQQQIVQDKDGEDRHFQAVLQGFQLLRGVLAGALLFALAGPLAAFLNIPDVAWAYQVMAVMPVLRALQHFDIHRLNRSLRYGPLILTGVVPALVSLAAVYPLVLWFGDYRVMLFALVLQEALGALTSHLMAERPFRLAWDRAIVARSLRFGWPLLLNGALLFLVMQGDKVIVGRELGMVALGIFGMGVTLTLTPTLILAKSVQNLFLPKLAAAVDDAAAWERLSTAIMLTVMALSLVFAVGFVVVSTPLVAVLLDEDFAPLAGLLPWLGLMLAFRILKAGPTVMAIAAGRTGRLVWANIPRVVLLIPTAWVVANGGDLTTIILIAVVGEALGFWLTLRLVADDLSLPYRRLGTPAFATTVVFGSVVLVAADWIPGPDWAGLITCVLTLLFAAPAFHSLIPFLRPQRAPQ